jgi:K(+)-stimulated pyrophosphate-energized sodium pump
MLAGATVTGVLMALFMANSGGAWDNAKKYIEGGAYGGKGSEPHKAAVVGDTVGDPFKDTSGPSLNILIKLMSVVSLVLGALVRPGPRDHRHPGRADGRHDGDRPFDLHGAAGVNCSW